MQMTGRRSGLTLARLGVGLLFLLAAGCLAGCDQKGFVEGFNKSFDPKVHDGCVKAATEKRDAATAERYCSCVVTQLDKLSPWDRVTLDPKSDKAQAAINYCNAQLDASPF
jgi:hypothetical protein